MRYQAATPGEWRDQLIAAAVRILQLRAELRRAEAELAALTARRPAP